MIYDGVITKPPLNMTTLAHHGIKGQKWGVQNGPPYPLRQQTKTGFKKGLGTKPGIVEDRHYIKKGTKMYRMTTLDKENNAGATYVTYNPIDRAFYRAYIYSMNPGAKVYETTFKSTEDLIVPSQKELAEVQQKVMKENPKLKQEAIEGSANFRAFKEYRKDKIDQMMRDNEEVQSKISVLVPPGMDDATVDFKYDKKDPSMLIAYNVNTGQEAKIGTLSQVNNYFRYQEGKIVKEEVLKQIKDKKLSDFYVYSSAMGANKDVKAAMIKELKARGYNAVVDEAGVGVYEIPGRPGKVSREGVEPIIVFDRDRSLKPIKTKVISRMDAAYGSDQYNNWRNLSDDRRYRQITWK